MSESVQSASGTSVPGSTPAAASTAPSAQSEATMLALLAYGELACFQRLATDAKFAPTMQDTIELAKLSVLAHEHFEMLADQVEQLGGDIGKLLEKSESIVLSTRKDRTRPRDWYESLMKGCVIDGILRDFYRSALGTLDDTSNSVAAAVLDDTRPTDHLLNRLSAAVAEDSQLGSRLALWGRKLVAEALSRGRELVGGAGLGLDEAAVAEIVQQATRKHSQRMARMGLVA